jgi:hypothetical protein
MVDGAGSDLPGKGGRCAGCSSASKPRGWPANTKLYPGSEVNAIAQGEPCLGRFDELKSIRFDGFTKKHDLYWDIPLNGNLPQLVIDLPELSEADTEERLELDETEDKLRPKGRIRN